MTDSGGSDQASAPVRPGDVLAGKYRVERVLGMGGMGVVVAAHHLQLDQRVALKFLLPAALQNAEAVARFSREARAAVRIRSEHVARVTDVGQLENGSPFMVMEYLEGSDLSAWLKDRGALPVEQAVEFLLQACEAIADAHSLGIVHRDLKPANLFCIRRNDGLLSIKVLDFGISKLTGFSASAPSMGMTKTTAMMGSPLYMSPEQMQSPKTVDGRSDLWSLGVVLFELLTAQPPFQGETFPELVLNIAAKSAPPLRAFRSDVPEELERVVARSLEKDRDKRFQNVAELAVALAPFAPKSAYHSVERISRVIHGSGTAASVSSLPPAPATQPDAGATPVGTAGAWGQTAPTASSTRRKAVLVGVGAAVGLMALAGLFAVKLVGRPAAPPVAGVSGPALVSPASASPPAPLVDPQSPGTLAPPPASASSPPASPIEPAVATKAPPTRAAARSDRKPDVAVPPPTPAGAPPKATPPAAAPATPASPTCDPPYYYNARHDRVFKPECL